MDDGDRKGALNRADGGQCPTCELTPLATLDFKAELIGDRSSGWMGGWLTQVNLTTPFPCDPLASPGCPGLFTPPPLHCRSLDSPISALASFRSFSSRRADDIQK